MTRQKIFYRIGQLAALVLVASVWWWGSREMNYVSFSRIPLAQFGQVVPHTTKGIVVYITLADAAFDRMLRYAGLGSGIIAAVCVLASGELSRIMNPPKPPPALEI